MKKNKNLKGFTLLEVIIALFVVTVGVMGAVFAIQQTIILASYSSARLTAAYLAQEGIEIVRNIRDTNWLERVSDPTNSWDEGLTDCNGSCDENLGNGCIVDYTFSSQLDPNLLSYTGQYLYIDASGFFSHTSSFDQTKFQRKIVIDTSNSNYLAVCVLINWQERGKPYSFPVKEHLYNWY